ncbi:MAG: FAD-dependent oxidoreductase [Pseudomonadota bacterium]|nr:FAD-dependent oxidoreductase [Pseudomonadota bacterium]
MQDETDGPARPDPDAVHRVPDPDAGRRAIVVGGGIAGVSAATWLARFGWKVTLIDRGAPGGPEAASFGNAGILSRSGIVPVAQPGLLAQAPRLLLDPDGPLFLRWSYLPRLAPFLVRFIRHGREDEVRRIAAALARLLTDAVDQHRALAEGAPEAEDLIRGGDYGFLYRDRAGYEADAFGHALRRAHGFEPLLAEGAGLRDRDPGLSSEWGFAAIYPDHGWIADPGAYVAALAARFVAMGGTVRRGEVAALDGEGRVALTGGARMQADRVVLAAGVRSRPLIRALGRDVPMESERGYHLHLRAAADARPAHPWMAAALRVAATPMADGVRLAGVVEFGGTEAGPSAGPPALLRRAAARLWPEAEWEAETDWMGHRPSTVDSLPVIGPVPGAERVVAAFGGQHVGLTAGPRIGRMAAEIAAGLAAPDPAFSPGRF